jgi:predicted RNase H-like nuclease (RuvC/YqgF family)
MDGMASPAGQFAVPLVLATVAGVLIGHVVWPRRTATDPAADLAAAREEAATLRSALARVTDQKDTEIGRLETGAIEAMETTMASSQQRIGELEARLRESTEECRRLEVRLQSEQSRTARLEAALVERDRRILRLSSPPGPPA